MNMYLFLMNWYLLLMNAYLLFMNWYLKLMNVSLLLMKWYSIRDDLVSIIVQHESNVGFCIAML